MKLGIILQSNNPEHVWNTLRFGITSLKEGHLVQMFLFNEAVEIEDIADTDDFDISKKLEEFKELKGAIFACKTCLKARAKEKSNVCPVSNIRNLVKMVEESDKVLVFS